MRKINVFGKDVLIMSKAETLVLECYLLIAKSDIMGIRKSRSDEKSIKECEEAIKRLDKIIDAL